MITKNMVLLDDIPEGIVTKTVNEIIRRIQARGRDVDVVESEHIKLRLLHYSKKRGIELLLKEYKAYGFTKGELEVLYDRMEIERLTYLLNQKAVDIGDIEINNKSEKEMIMRRKSLRKIKNLVDLYGPIEKK